MTLHSQGLPADSSKDNRVFVDAKIMGRHDVYLPKKTLVAYVVEGNEQLRNVVPVEGVDQTDEAELMAVEFAISELKNTLGKLTILCDNESVVSEILRGEARPRSRPVLSKIQREIKDSESMIRVQLPTT